MRFSLHILALAALPFAPADSARAAGSTPIVAEIVTFKLNDGVSDAEFVEISKASEAFVRSAPGFISRQLSKGDDGIWTDYVLWQDMESALAVGKAFPEQGFAPSLMGAIASGSEEMRHQYVMWQME